MARMPDIEAEAAKAVGWFEKRLPHHHAAPQPPASAPATMTAATAAASPTQEERMTVLADIRNDLAAAAHDVAAKAVEFEQQVLPAVAARLTELESNPVVVALGNAVHVPADNLDIVVAMIEKLETIWAPPAQAAPEQPAVPVGQ